LGGRSEFGSRFCTGDAPAERSARDHKMNMKSIAIDVSLDAFEDVATISDFRKRIDAIEAAVPEEFRNNINIDIDNDIHDGWSLNAHYTRPETEQDRQKSERDKKRWLDKAIDSEYALYLRLKEKFEK
jgi:DUF4097 and DUF4098 domain-containing protein YvlB